MVIPVYNEEDNIPFLWEELKGVLKSLKKDYEVIFVDDGSTDNSFDLLKRISDKEECVRVIKLKKNCGQSAAFDVGFKKAKGKIIVTMDADLQNDPKDIPHLLEVIEDYDVVCGWRYNRKDPWLKRVSSKIANFIRNKLTGEEIKDIGCSLKAFRKECVTRLKLYDGMHRFFPTLAKLEGFKVTEVQVNHRPRLFGRTKYNIRNRIFRSFIDLLAVCWMKKRYLRYEIEDTLP